MNHAFITGAALVQLPETELGGKALGLRRLMDLGLSVPPWGLIPASAVEAAPWEKGEWNPRPLIAFFDAMRAAGFDGLALRSSTDLEDGVEASHAGQFETCYLRTPAGFDDALRQVAASVGASGARMAIIVQALLKPDSAGVLFSANPAAAHYDEACLEVVYGIGKRLVDGAHTPSQFILNLEEGGVRLVRRGENAPAQLGPDLVQSALDALLRIEAAWERPVDIEWAAAAGRFWLLQARPITALTLALEEAPPCCATCWFFDQRFSKPISPFTRDTLLRTVIGSAIAGAIRLRRRPLPPRFLFYHGGQAYVSHDAYRRMLGGSPRWLMDADLRQLFPAQCACPPEAPRWDSFLHYLVTASIALWKERRNALRTIHAWKSFQDQLPQRLDALDADVLGDEATFCAQWESLEELSKEFLAIHRWSVLWANYAFRGFRTLKRFLPSRWRSLLEERLHRSLRLPTAEANRALKAWLDGELSKEAFLKDFGNRSESLDFADPTWAELAESGALRQRYAPLEEIRFFVKEPDASRFRILAYPLIRLLEMREEQRFAWEGILARQRRQILTAAKALEQRGAIQAPEEIWCYHWDELRNALFHQQPLPRRRLQLRQHRLHIDALVSTPAFIGPVRERADEDARQLRGIGASGGRAAGRVRLVHSPQELRARVDEEAIILLQALDPAWTALLQGARGLIIERGGALSHAAILAREYGVPLVIGVNNATRLIPDGSQVRIDGATGRIWLEAAPADQPGV